MIEIRLAPESRVKERCGAQGMSETCYLYEAWDGKTLLGSCAFSISGDRGRLLSLHMEEQGLRPIADGIVRSTLSMMAARGVTAAACAPGAGADERMLHAIGFRPADGGMEIVISESIFAQ